MASVVSVKQVRDHLSSPPWSAEQEAACALLIARRQTELQRYFGVPIDPIDRVETVKILDSGLLATDWPVFKVYSIDGVAAAGSGATFGQALPSPYTWRDEGWITAPKPVVPLGLTTRPFDIMGATATLGWATVAYAGGWGPLADITGAIIDKVAATMINRHDDTVTARQLDAESPPPLKEEWTDKELDMLRSRRRARGGR